MNAAIIVNYKTPQFTIECLRSIAPDIEHVPGFSVLVVDNASQDGSVEIMQSAIDSYGWNYWANILPLDKNLGFAGGNNKGFDWIRVNYPDTELILLLNSDTLVHAGTLQYCIAKLRSDPSIGALSCLVLNSDGTVQDVCRRFPKPMRAVCSVFGLPSRYPRVFGWANTENPSWDRKTTVRDVDWIGGAFMFLRKEMVQSIGLFDPEFFFYGEDIELCHRIWKHGWRVHYDPHVSIVHFGGASSDPTRLAEAQRSAHRWQARYLVQRKCYGMCSEWIVRMTDISWYAMRVLMLRLGGARQRDHYKQVSATLSLLCEIFVRQEDVPTRT